jgi:hypothetical protein
MATCFFNSAVYRVSKQHPIIGQITKIVEMSPFHPKKVNTLSVIGVIHVAKVILTLFLFGRHGAIGDRGSRIVQTPKPHKEPSTQHNNQSCIHTDDLSTHATRVHV